MRSWCVSRWSSQIKGESIPAIKWPPVHDAAAMIREAAEFFQSRFTVLA